MKLRYKMAILLGTGVVAGALFVILQPGPSYDVRKVDPRLNGLRAPYQKVKTYFWADGGSIGIKIVDRDGRQEQFSVRAKLGDTDRYTRVFVGALNDSLPGAIEISDPEHTRRMLIRVLGDYPNRTPWDDANLANLRGYPKDRVRFWYHWLRGNLKSSGVYIY